MILNYESLAETLWNLEEARLTGVPADDPEANAALDWILERPGGYRPALFNPTPEDIEGCRATPTGDYADEGDLSSWFRGHGARPGRLKPTRLDTKHILGEEAVRALILWGRSQDWASLCSLESILAFGERRSGAFCCAHCSVARWRALAVGQAAGWEDAVRDGLRMLDAQVSPGLGWSGFPAFYTLLALADIPLPEVRTVLSCARIQPETLLARIRGDGQQARFRRRAVEWLVNRC